MRINLHRTHERVMTRINLHGHFEPSYYKMQ